MVASLTAERDGDLRKAALNCLATGYKILGEFKVTSFWMLSNETLYSCYNISNGCPLNFDVGDDIWKNVGKLTEAQRSMLDEKFKWKVSY